MQRKCFSFQQIVALLNTGGLRWKATYGGLEVSNAKRLKDLEHENGRLKRM